MKAPLTVSLVSFYVPDSVSAEPFPAPKPRPVSPTALTPLSLPSGPGPYFSIPLCELDSNTLASLCSNFRNSVFELAGKEQPPTAARPDPSDALTALDTIKILICDVAGQVFAGGTPEDDELIRRALCTIDTFLNQL